MYDSKEDTNKHQSLVREYLEGVNAELERRAGIHDNSKLEQPEKSIFDVATPKLKELTYGSDEYKAQLKELGIALEHHYKNNRHHPEHFENGIEGMDLFDLIEMLCDWGAATFRHADGDIYKSIEVNAGRFKLGKELTAIFRNTVKNHKIGKGCGV